MLLRSALRKVYLSTNGAAPGPTPGRSLRSPVAHHLCTRQNLAAAAAAVTAKRSAKEETRRSGMKARKQITKRAEQKWACPPLKRLVNY